MSQKSSTRHPIDIAALSDYLASNFSSIRLPIEVHQFAHGQSNPTYYITDAGNTKYVLRKKPPGQLISQTAHAIEREYKILAALPDSFPSPKAYSLCLDTSIIGTPFYLMEFITGRIFHRVDLPEIPDREERRLIFESAVDVLARLHALKPIEIGLGDFGSTEDFYSRQIRSLGKISAAQAQVSDLKTGTVVGEIEKKDQLLQWYRTRRPPHQITIIHGDFKLDNLLAVIMQGIAARAAKGQASSAKADTYARLFQTFAGFAVQAIERSETESSKL